MWDYIARKQLVWHTHTRRHSICSEFQLQLINLFIVFSHPQSYLWQGEEMIWMIPASESLAPQWRTSLADTLDYNIGKSNHIKARQTRLPTNKDSWFYKSSWLSTCHLCECGLQVQGPGMMFSKWLLQTGNCQQCSILGKAVFPPQAWRTPFSLSPHPPLLSPPPHPLLAAVTTEEG